MHLFRCLLIICCFIFSYSYADTIDHFMHIASSLPQMEMKADPQAQAWARSARNILDLTSESIYESLTIANANASRLGNPLFCLPRGAQITPTEMSLLIQKTYQNLHSQQSDKDKMSVSQVALLGLSQSYPCARQANALPRIRIQHRSAGVSTKALAAAAALS